MPTKHPEVFRGTTLDQERVIRKQLRNELSEQIFNSLWESGHEKEAKAFISCGNWLKYGECPAGGHRLEPHPCNSMFCVNCSTRKAKLLQQKILARCPRPGRKYLSLVLTAPNQPTLSRAAITAFVKAFARLRRSKAWAEARWDGVRWVGVTGGVYSLECTYNQGYRHKRVVSASGEVSVTRVPDVLMRGWHLHIHCLLEIPAGRDFGWLPKLKEAWFKSCEGARNLHLERVFSKGKRGQKIYGRVDRKCLNELVKYVTKAVSFAWSPDLIHEFLTAFRHVRRVQAFGSLVGSLKDAEREPGDEEGLLKCSCGSRHLHSEFTWSHEPVHIRDTILMPDGTRQMKFPFAAMVGSVPDDSPPPWELVPFEPKHVGQNELGFSGAMPEESVQGPNLFEGVA